MPDFTMLRATAHPWLRRNYVRRDSAGRWYWYHPLCKSAEAQLATQRQALGSALEHSCDSHPVRYATHIQVEPMAHNGSASWLCPSCAQYCASHNPCDCCMDDAWSNDA